MPEDDLAALLTAATRRLIDAERPLLAAHGLSMWGYVVLSQLARVAAPSQLALAQTIRYDKTRLIGVLEALEDDGLIARAPDPADRRNLGVRITPAGERRRAAAQADIRTMENDVLGGLGPRDRALLSEILTRRGADGVS